MPDHGKLMHLFMVREPALDAMAHLHPIARSAAGLDFDADVPSLPAGRYRVYGDIVHESGYAQTLISSVELTGQRAQSAAPTDPTTHGSAAPDCARLHASPTISVTVHGSSGIAVRRRRRRERNATCASRCRMRRVRR
jgi:hypothetical protein